MIFKYFGFEDGSHKLGPKSYDIATALRGPDTELYDFAIRMKRIFTYAIRSYAHCTSDTCSGEPPMQEYIDETLALAKTMRKPSWWKHWSTHIHIALTHMGNNELQMLLRDINAAFLGPTRSHKGIDRDFKEIYYTVESDGNRYTTFHLNFRLSLQQWGLGVTSFFGKMGWQVGLHLLCFHIESSGWYKKRG